MHFVLSRVLLEVQHYKGESILLSFEDSRTYLYPFDAVYIQMGYNRLVGKAVEVETVGYPVPTRLLHLKLVVRVSRRIVFFPSIT